MSWPSAQALARTWSSRLAISVALRARCLIRTPCSASSSGISWRSVAVMSSSSSCGTIRYSAAVEAVQRLGRCDEGGGGTTQRNVQGPCPTKRTKHRGFPALLGAPALA